MPDILRKKRIARLETVIDEPAGEPMNDACVWFQFPKQERTGIGTKAGPAQSRANFRQRDETRRRFSGMLPAMSRQVVHAYDLVLVLLSKELKVRYKSTMLGYAWSVLNPLAFALILFFVFKIVIRLQIEHYPLFLVTALFPWQWFQNSVNAANRFFLNNAALIKRVYFPRSSLVLAGVLNDLVHFLASLLVILVLMAYYRVSPQLSWLWLLPVLLICQFLLTLGLSLMVATANLFFRDLERLIAIMTMLWFYLTPIVYDPGMVPKRFVYVNYLNPMGSLIICWREMFLHGRVQVDYLLASAVSSVIYFVAGAAIFQWKKWRFAEIV